MTGSRISRLLLPLLVCALAWAAPAAAGAPPASARHPVVCAPFEATGTGQDLGGGQTTATIFAAGQRIGTTTAAFTVTGQSGTIVSFVGELTFFPDGVRGTLVADLEGSLDVATGAFESSSTSLTGTRRLRRVTGTLFIQGVQDLATGAFTETLTGTLCAPRRR